MKSKNTTISFSALSILLVLLAFASCGKPPAPFIPDIETLPVTVEVGDKAVFKATIHGVNTSVNGFLFATTPEPTLETAIHIPAGVPINDSIMTTVSVDPSTPAYYVRAYAFINDEMLYGNEVVFSTGHSIGQSFGGGRVAYILQASDPGYDATTEHGLIIANEFFGSDILWGCDTIYVSGAIGAAIGTGAANTASILATCEIPDGSAAALCNDYEADGFTDWFLPSFDELNAIDSNFDILQDLESGHYWSSTHSPDTLKAWAVHLWTNEEEEPYPSGEYQKILERRAIAVRSF
ncbi:MAG: DUF1566 domain-containing protein [Crocinitomix sp.]|nr:DUF1566 domain-containing protein [Crocinitomix sp.]